MNDDGVRGEGSLYQLGLGYSVTGIYMNKKLADKLGHHRGPDDASTSSRTTSQKAKAAGVLPDHDRRQDGVVNFIVQALINQYGDKQKLIDWIFNKPGATIRHPRQRQGRRPRSRTGRTPATSPATSTRSTTRRS